MKALAGESSIRQSDTGVPMISTKTKLLAILEVLVVYGVVQVLLVFWTSTGIVQWETENLGWPYTGMLILVGIPVLVVWLARRSWAEVGVSSTDWQTNLTAVRAAACLQHLRSCKWAFLTGLGGWALAAFAAGLFSDVLHEVSGTLLAPGIAHGLADAVGEPFIKVFGWM
jgi:hypothetical protein